MTPHLKRGSTALEQPKEDGKESKKKKVFSELETSPQLEDREAIPVSPSGRQALAGLHSRALPALLSYSFSSSHLLQKRKKK